MHFATHAVIVHIYAVTRQLSEEAVRDPDEAWAWHDVRART
jgi:hypothetical protein